MKSGINITVVALMAHQDTGVSQTACSARPDLRYCGRTRAIRRGLAMPIAPREGYADMLPRAKEQSYAFPSINCTSSETINAALKGFADAGSDGIIQFSTGGAEVGSGHGIEEMVTDRE